MSGGSATRSTQYARVAGELHAAIRKGRYPLGGLLPTEMALCEHFGVSRITVRAAIRELEVRGMVSRRPGIGTRVEAKTGRERFVHASDSIEDFLQSLATLTFRLLSARTVTADAALAGEYGCAEGDALLRMEALRIDADGLPVCYSIHHLPAEYATAARQMHGRTGSLATRIARRAAAEVDDTRQMIDAHNLSAAEARILESRRSDAALLIRRWYATREGRVLVCARSLFPKGRYTYSARIRREQAAGTEHAAITL